MRDFELYDPVIVEARRSALPNYMINILYNKGLGLFTIPDERYATGEQEREAMLALADAVLDAARKGGFDAAR